MVQRHSIPSRSKIARFHARRFPPRLRRARVLNKAVSLTNPLAWRQDPLLSPLQMPELSDEALFNQIAQLGSAMMMFIIRADANEASSESEPGTSSPCFNGMGASPGSRDDLSESYEPDAQLGPARYASLRTYLFGNAAWIEKLRRGAKRYGEYASAHLSVP